MDLARKGIEAWNQRDADLWLTYASPEIEWIPAGPAAVEQAVYDGYDDAARGLAAVWDTWEVFEFVEPRTAQTWEIRSSGWVTSRCAAAPATSN